MRGTFSNNVLMNADLSKWDTSAATTMYSMFIGCAVMNIDLSKWYEGTMYSMFIGCAVMNIDLSKW